MDGFIHDIGRSALDAERIGRARKREPFEAAPFDLADFGRRRALTDRGVACIAAVRAAIGPKRRLLVDVPGRLTPDAGLALAVTLSNLTILENA